MRCPHCNEEHPGDCLYCPRTGRPMPAGVQSLPVADASKQAVSNLKPKKRGLSWLAWLIILEANCLVLLVAVLAFILIGVFSPTGTASNLTGSSSTTYKATPTSAPQWSSNGPDGGSVAVILADPQDAAILYVGTAGGVFKSTDGGDSWFLSSTGLNGIGISSLVFDPNSSTTLYAGTVNNGVYQSKDGGQSWTSLNDTALKYASAYQLSFDANQVLYATTYKGLFKTGDKGSHWSQLDTGVNSGLNDTEVRLLAIDPKDADHLYALTEKNLFISTDGGVFWQMVDFAFGSIYFNQILIDPANPQNIYLAAIGKSFQSVDGGLHWSELSIDNLNTIDGFAVDSASSNKLYAFSGSDIYQRADAGETWTKISSGPANVSSITALAFNPNSAGVFYIGTRAGLFKATAAGAWTPINLGLTASDVSSLTFVPTQPSRLFAITDLGLFVSKDRGSTWQNVTQIPSTVYTLADDPTAPATLYAGTYHGIYKSMDGGASWAKADKGMDQNWEDIRAIAIDPDHPDTLYAAGDAGVYRSTDGGDSWVSIVNGLPEYPEIVSIAIDPAQTNRLFVGSYNGLFTSSDGGSHWSQIRTLSNKEINFMAIVPTSPSTLYVSTNDGLYTSTDQGASWIKVTFQSSWASVYALAFDPHSVDDLYLGTYDGLWQSLDGGKTWTQIDLGVQWITIQSLAIDPSQPSTLFVGSAGDGEFNLTAGR